MHVQHRTLSTSSELLLKPDLKPPHLEDIIKQLWPEWTQDEYRKYYSSLDKLGVPSCLPSEHVQAMVEGTALGFHLNSETLILLRALLLRIGKQYR